MSLIVVLLVVNLVVSTLALTRSLKIAANVESYVADAAVKAYRLGRGHLRSLK